MKLVKLKSGGPCMVAATPNGSIFKGYLECRWFDSKNQLQKEIIPEECLEEVKYNDK